MKAQANKEGDLVGSEQRGTTPQAPPVSHERPSLSLSLRPNPQAPSRARAALRAFSANTALAASESATLALLVSELVSNAVLHSDAPSDTLIEVRAWRLGEHAMHVEVLDAGSGFAPAVPTRNPTGSSGGYGLFLVHEHASRWGVDREGGARVWFELDTGLTGAAREAGGDL